MQRCVAQLRKEAPSTSLTSLCALLGASRSGYYASRARLRRPAQPCAVTGALVQAFAASGRSYGSRRLCAQLRQNGHSVGRYRVRSLMRINGLQSSWRRRRFVTTTDSRHVRPVAENVLDRRFNPSQPNTAWVADITYVPTRAGWQYLATVMDLFSRRIVGWAMAQEMPAELVCTALRTAITQRKPPPGLVVHSDRGSQYASEVHQALLSEHGLHCSMSRKGNCWDNAVMERFFLSLKRERIWQRDYANHPEAKRDIADYIVNFYNSMRLHSTLGYQSPSAFERAALEAAKQPIEVSAGT